MQANINANGNRPQIFPVEDSIDETSAVGLKSHFLSNDTQFLGYQARENNEQQQHSIKQRQDTIFFGDIEDEINVKPEEQKDVIVRQSLLQDSPLVSYENQADANSNNGHNHQYNNIEVNQSVGDGQAALIEGLGIGSNTRVIQQDSPAYIQQQQEQDAGRMMQFQTHQNTTNRDNTSSLSANLHQQMHNNLNQQSDLEVNSQSEKPSKQSPGNVTEGVVIDEAFDSNNSSSSPSRQQQQQVCELSWEERQQLREQYSQIAADLLNNVEDKINQFDNMDVYVRNPKEMNRYVVYEVKCLDKEGYSEGWKRYNLFNMYREALVARLPGLYIPKLPPKKVIGNKDSKFIEERRYQLQQFLKKIAQLPYIMECEETMMFTRPTENSEKTFQKLPRQSTAATLERYRTLLDINEKVYTSDEISKFQTTLAEFSSYCKIAIPSLRKFRRDLKHFSAIKGSSIVNTQVVIDEMSKYEATNYKLYIGLQDSTNIEDSQYNDQSQVSHPSNNKLILNSDQAHEIKETCAHLTANMRNPYTDYYHWCKSELYDIRAMQEAVNGKEIIRNQRNKMFQRRTNYANSFRTAQDQNSGPNKSTFKNNNQPQLAMALELLEKELENITSLLNIVTIYFAQRLIPVFKKEKTILYKRMVSEFAVLEANNASQLNNFWSSIDTMASQCQNGVKPTYENSSSMV